MISKRISLYLLGFYELEIEGIFINRFINLLISKKIVIIYSKMEKSTVLKCRCLKKDIDKIKEIAKKSNCLINVKCEKGMPNLLNKYKKRKWLFIICFIGIIVIYFYSLFIWNISINVDCENAEKDDDKNIEIVHHNVEDVLKENNIQKGTFKYKINDKKEEIINKLKLKNEMIVWVGVKVEGINLNIDIKVHENILDDNENNDDLIEKENNNIYADKEGKIVKITVFSGTARKNIGDVVKEGDLLVEGIIEGKYKGDRFTGANADIILEKEIIYEEEMAFETEIKEKTGNIENKVEIYINNFKINLNKSLLNFEKYDTIRENKRVKLFSKYYLPIEMSFIKYEEWKLVKKNYNKQELENIIVQKIDEKFKEEYDVSSFEKIDIDKQTKENDGKLKLILTYKVQEKIGTKRD